MFVCVLMVSRCYWMWFRGALHLSSDLLSGPTAPAAFQLECGDVSDSGRHWSPGVCPSKSNAMVASWQLPTFLLLNYGCVISPPSAAPMRAIPAAQWSQQSQHARVVRDAIARVAWTVVIVSAASAAVVANAVLTSSEKAALVALYQATGGSGWTHQTGWSTPTSDPCTSSWYGVTCSGSSVG